MSEPTPGLHPGRVRERRNGLLLIGLLLLVAYAVPTGGCRWRQAGAALPVEFRRGQPAEAGGTKKLDDIEGRKVGGVVAVSFVPGNLLLWRNGWFCASAGLALALALLALYRYRLRWLNLRFEERLAERTRVAQEIHDTFLQDVLSVSMQLHVVVDGLPEDSPARAPLGHIQNLMGRIIEEGHNTLKGLSSDGGAATGTELELSVPADVAFRTERPAPPRKKTASDREGRDSDG